MVRVKGKEGKIPTSLMRASFRISVESVFCVWLSADIRDFIKMPPQISEGRQKGSLT